MEKSPSKANTLEPFAGRVVDVLFKPNGSLNTLASDSSYVWFVMRSRTRPSSEKPLSLYTGVCHGWMTGRFVVLSHSKYAN